MSGRSPRINMHHHCAGTTYSSAADRAAVGSQWSLRERSVACRAAADVVACAPALGEGNRMQAVCGHEAGTGCLEDAWPARLMRWI